MARERLDKVLVDRGLVASRERARALIMAGKVRVGGIPESKPGTQVAAEPRVHLIGYGPSSSTIGANRAGRAAVASLVKWLGAGEAALTP